MVGGMYSPGCRHLGGGDEDRERRVSTGSGVGLRLSTKQAYALCIRRVDFL